MIKTVTGVFTIKEYRGMKKTIRKFAGLVMAGAMFVYMPAVAMAERYDISQGSIQVVAEVNAQGETIYTVNSVADNSQIVIYGTTDSGVEANVVINSGAGAKAVVVFDGLNIDKTGCINNAAVTTSGAGDVTIELDGNSSVKSGYERAGIQKENTGLLTIRDSNGTAGSLEAQGGISGAGIGGGNNGSVSNIVIESGEVTATGGDGGAGIGGGYNGSGTVTITGGEVTALGISGGAGIGGGAAGAGTVNISGGTVVATSDACGAGIGGGSRSTGSAITISGSANVYASGGTTTAYLTSGAGSAIGEGGNVDPNNQDRVEGVESYDATGLYDTGSINLFPVGTTVEQITKNQVQGTTIKGTVSDPSTTIIEDNEEEQPKDEQPKDEKPKAEEPKVEEPPAYTERSCIADIDVAALIEALLKNNPNATVLNIEFDDNICLTPEIMTALFADNRVAKNCYFWHEGKRYVLHIGAVNKQSPLYTSDFEMLKLEPDGLAGFKKMALIFSNLGVTLDEVK